MYLFIPPAVAFTISFFTSMAGISGAFLLLPFQMSVLRFTTTSVTSTNFLFNVTGTPGGVYRYIKECRFAWPVALIIVAGIIPGVLIGYYIRIRFFPDPKSFPAFLTKPAQPAINISSSDLLPVFTKNRFTIS